MEIIVCPVPDGARDGLLEPAPLSSLLPGGESAAWRAYWGMDDRYYACLQTADGVERWYRIAEASPGTLRTPGGGLPAIAAAPELAPAWGDPDAAPRRGPRTIFAVRTAPRGRGTTSLAIRAGRSRRPRQ